MAGTLAMLWAGSILAGGAVLALRLAWGRPMRTWPVLACAWALLAAGLGCGGLAHGAWGLAVVSLVTMAVAGLLLLIAATTTAGKTRRPAERGGHAPRQEPRHIMRRMTTFLLVVPLAFVVAWLGGLAGRGLAGLAGWHEADSNTLTLFAVPLFWALLAVALLMTGVRQRQLTLLGVPALGSLVLLLMARLP